MQCPYCGAQLETGNVYCEVCGKEVQIVPDYDSIVDEVLSVGDMNFKKKCEQRMSEMLAGGTTLLFVSHSISQVESLCDHALWIDKGVERMQGDVKTVCAAYAKEMEKKRKIHRNEDS